MSGRITVFGTCVGALAAAFAAGCGGGSSGPGGGDPIQAPMVRQFSPTMSPISFFGSTRRQY